MSQVEGEQVTPSCRDVAEQGHGDRDRACCMQRARGGSHIRDSGVRGCSALWSRLQKPLEVALPVLEPALGGDALGPLPALP